MGGDGKGFQKEDETPIDERTIEAVWAWDSETGGRRLLDLKTGKEIGRWKRGPAQNS